ncbi:hypothetical protein [Synechococcus sp. UW140]|uniref:hypothetical protein n=1 Tax=Synechococcus sp. UW140 TaxID=368503 RepID=UPI00313800A3
MNKSQIDIEDLFDWLEQQPELAQLRKQAAATPCEYCPTEITTDLRLKTKANTELANDEGIIGKFRDIIWVPGRNMRGNAFSTPELDRSLSSVAKLMSISTLWDFVTTIPLFSFSLSLFSWGAIPAGTALSFILLWASNVAGENATDRRPKHTSKANWSLAAFVLLSVAKTLVSGVGVDLMIGNRAIQAEYAQKLAENKLSEDRANLTEQSKPSSNLIAATQRCSELQDQMKQLGANRAVNNLQYTSVLVQANGTFEDNKSDKNLTNEELSKKYSTSKGVCRYEQALKDLQKEKNQSALSLIEKQANAQKSLPPLKYLQQYAPNIYNEHFKGSGSNIEWVNGSEAVGEATDQFYKKLLAGEFGLLGFSLFTFAISFILTGSASVMLYLIGKNPQVQASYTGTLGEYRNRRLSDYENLVKKEEV